MPRSWLHRASAAQHDCVRASAPNPAHARCYQYQSGLRAWRTRLVVRPPAHARTAEQVGSRCLHATGSALRTSPRSGKLSDAYALTHALGTSTSLCARTCPSSSLQTAFDRLFSHCWSAAVRPPARAHLNSCDRACVSLCALLVLAGRQRTHAADWRPCDACTATCSARASPCARRPRHRDHVIKLHVPSVCTAPLPAHGSSQSP